ncbi:hypothetical protein KBC25_01420 [Candidatus Pacearchaeota archaeon]|nr:hypothetical protein [Candidatus Pacearchaeota archaeon]
MGRGVKIYFAFLFLILIAGIVCAYPSFSLVNEDTNSKKAVIVYNVDPIEVINDYSTVIQLNYLYGDFADLIGYLRNTKIMTILYYNGDIDSETLKYIEEESGVNFRRLLRSTDKAQKLYSLNEEEILDTPEIIISGKSIEQQNSVKFTFVTSLIIIIIISIIVAVRLIPKKKKRK